MKYIKLLILFTVFAIPTFGQSHQATLTWTASTDAGTAYNIYRASGSCTGATFTKVNSVAAGVVTYVDTTVTVGSYCYQVTATLNGAESVPSNPASAVILPAPPTSLKTTSQ